MTERAYDGVLGLVPGVTGSSSAFLRASTPLAEVRLLMPDRLEGVPAETYAGAFTGLILRTEATSRRELASPYSGPWFQGEWGWADFGCIGAMSAPMVRWDVEMVHDTVMAWKTPSKPCASQDVLVAIVRSFSSLNDVTCIYVDRTRPTPRAWVMIGKDRYDDALMDRLLEAERGILNSFRPMYVSFNYPPDPGRTRRRATVGRVASLVFER